MLPAPCDYVFGCRRRPAAGTPIDEDTVETLIVPHAMYWQRALPEAALRPYVRPPDAAPPPA